MFCILIMKKFALKWFTLLKVPPNYSILIKKIQSKQCAFFRDKTPAQSPF
jgi:hypothetical protein